MAANKNSLYVQSLVSFLNDTKPYRCKITEVVEEYRFFDEMFVHMKERFFNNTTLKSSYPYNFFSAGANGNLSFPLHQVLNSNVRPGKFNLSQANTDLPGVPLAFDPKSMSSYGMKDAYVRRNGVASNAQPLLEGHDIFQSHGAFVFSIRQTTGSNQVGSFIKEYSIDDPEVVLNGGFPLEVQLPFTPQRLFITGPAEEINSTSIRVTGPGTVRVFGLNDSPVYDTKYKELKNQGLFSHITDSTQRFALDVLKPYSAISKLMSLMDKIHQRILDTPNATQSRLAFNNTVVTLPKRVELSGNNNTVIEAAHTRVDGDVITFMSVPEGSGLVVGQSYFVTNSTILGFQLSLAPGSSTLIIPVTDTAIISPDEAIDLPRSYEALITAVELEGVLPPTGYSAWAWNNKKVKFSASFNDVQQPDHIFKNGDTVVFYLVTGNTNIVQGTSYFVINRTSNTYQLALTQNGAAIDITGAGGAYSAPRDIVGGVPVQSYVDLDLAALSPGLYFNQYTDIGQRETGNLRYSDVITDKLIITNIVGNENAENYEEWTLAANSSTTLIVVGSASGSVGVIDPTTTGVSFVSPQISFTATSTGALFTSNDNYALTPSGEVTIHKNAELETWSVIKVNPISYDRPTLQSLRFGHLEDASGRRDFITVLDAGFPSSTVIIRALTSTQFQITNSEDQGYSGIASVGAEYNDGRLQFTIFSGEQYQFAEGDTFFVEIKNEPPIAEDLDLYYGYDAGPYDSSNLSYNIVSNLLDDYLKTIDFHYDSRFLNYNLSAFNLQLSANAPGGEYRLRAEADVSRPLQMPSNRASLLDPLLVRLASTSNTVAAGEQTIDGIIPVNGDLVLLKNQTNVSTNGVYRVRTLDLWVRVADYPPTGTTSTLERPDLNVIHVVQGATNTGTYWKRIQPQIDFTYEQTTDLYDMPINISYEGQQSAADLDLSPNILLWYSNTFALERFDINAGQWVTISTGIQINSPHIDATFGLSFTIVPAAKPFIAAQITSTTYTDLVGTQNTSIVDTGDIIYFKVTNSQPRQIAPAGLTSVNVPRLIMHGDSYYATIPARWALTWNDANTYQLQGVYTAESAFAGEQVFNQPLVISTLNSSSYLNRQFGIHWTVVPGSVGLDVGDRITFQTFQNKPSYLVYGTVSGWQPNAEIGKWYWNGKIGFLIRAPAAHVFQNGIMLQGGGPVSVAYIRPDLSSCVYRVYSPVDGRWMLYKDGELVAYGVSVLDDGNIRLQMPAAVFGSEFIIRIDGDTHDLAVGIDLAVVRTDAGRSPNSTDILVIEKTESDFMSVAVQAVDTLASSVLSQLARTNINPLFVDHDARGGVALSATSPEILINTGFIPALPFFRNLDGEVAFSDEATSVTLVAASTGETIGTARSLTSNPKEPVFFTWDTSFATKYLPLNTDASIVTYGSGTDERMVVNMHEGIHFLLSGGGLETGSLFSEIVQVRLQDDHFMSVRSSYSRNMNVAIADGPFGGFLPGYDNMPYDAETHPNLQQYFLDAEASQVTANAQIDLILNELRVDIDMILSDMLAATDLAGVTNPDTPAEIDQKRAIEEPFNALIDSVVQQTSSALDALDILGGGFGYYDVGHPFVGLFEKAKELARLNVPGVAQSLELSVLLQLVNPYITGEITSTTLEQFKAALDADVFISRNPDIINSLDIINTIPVPNFGIPALGKGISINEKPLGVASTKLVESVVINVTDFGRPYDAYGYDVGELDASPDLLVQIYSESPPPLPLGGLPTAGMMYQNFESPVTVLLPARNIEIGFLTPPGAITFYVWAANDDAPRQIEIIEQLSDRRFRMSIHMENEFKLIIV